MVTTFSQAYVTGITNLCRLISKTDDNTAHNDLLDPIFVQLQSTVCDRFTFAVNGWFEEYLEQTLQLTPLKLLDKADKKLQILRAAKKLTANPNTELMALRAYFDTQNKQITTSLHKITSNLQSGANQYHHINQENIYQPRPRPDWFHKAPANPNTVHIHENREWRWCPKCSYGKGRWVSTHHPDHHIDGYVNPKRARGGNPNDTRPPPHKRTYNEHHNPNPKRPYYSAQIAMHEFPFLDIDDHSSD
jgi:hypothetical protein